MAEQLFANGIVNCKSSTRALKFVGPHYEANMLKCGAGTLGDIVGLCSNVKSKTAIKTLVEKMSANKRAGEAVKDNGPIIAPCNPRVCYTLLDLICYAKEHPEQFEGCTCNILVDVDRLRRLQATYVT
jgi:hypothetical protein